MSARRDDRRPGDSLAPSVSADDPLAGATIVVHDLSRGASTAVAPGAAVAAGTTGTTGTGGPAGVPPRSEPAARWTPVGRAVLLLGAGVAIGAFAVITYQGRPPAQVTFGTLVAAPRVEIRVHVDGAVLQPGVYRLAQGDRVEEAIKAAGGLAPHADANRINMAQAVRDGQRFDVPALPALPSVAGDHQAQPTPDSQGVPNTAEASSPSNAAAQGQPAPTSNAPPQSAVAPRPTNTPRPQPTARPTAFSGGRVNVNTATPAQLEQLPGLGSTSVQRIIAYRTANGPLRSLDDVRKAGVQEQFVRQAADFLAFD